MEKLAINGGKPVRTDPFPENKTIGIEEKKAVSEVLDGGILSGFLGEWSDKFYGGPYIQELERNWERYFRVKHAVSMNSATSGLYAAVGAAGIGPGDEVIVSPYTMSASATAALIYGGIPVFADIDPDIFTITPESIEHCITPYTKAIIAVDIFGHPADMDEIMKIARDHDLIVIEDAAQAPGAQYNGRYAGTLADIGVFSLNVHKTIHCGEGGIAVTSNEELALRLQLIRNHGEVVVRDKGVQDISNILGYNYRMTEIEAAIANEQLKKLDTLLVPRINAAEYLTKNIQAFEGIVPPRVKQGIKHGYYVYALKYQPKSNKIHRNKFTAALNAEGIPMYNGYSEPLYLKPLYQQRIAFGHHGFPFTYEKYKGKVSYQKGICPVAESMYEKYLMYTDICHANSREEDLDDVIRGIEKVSDLLLA